MIYLLEDDDSIRDLVMYTLSTQSMEVRGFDRPSEFWEAMTELPSLILLDIIMPIVNGFDFLEWIQNRPKYQHIPIVFTSIAATNENILKGLRMGVRDVLFKPYDWGRVERCVENLLALVEYLL